MDDKQKQVLLDLVMETYRLRNFASSFTTNVKEDRLLRRSKNVFSRFDKHFKEDLQEMGIEVLDFTGKPYDIGLPVQPINLEDFSVDEPLFIEMMIEPVIKEYGTANILKTGVVALNSAK